MPIRRIVTGRDDTGKSVVISDAVSPQARALDHTPGFVSAPIWTSEGTPVLGDYGFDPMAKLDSLVPGPGGSTFLVVTFPPDSVFAAPGFDAARAGAEHAEVSPGLAETFEPDTPGMHTTPTLDYAVVISGDIVMELDDGRTVTLGQGDTVVQQGTRHAWRNPSDAPATLAFVLLGARTE